MEVNFVAFWVVFAVGFCFHGVGASTDPGDTVALRSLMSQWTNLPPSWGRSEDPCGAPWDGVMCKGSRVTELRLSTMGMKGTLSGDISQLSELVSLDLSYNKDLQGSLSPNIGQLKKLRTLILVGCSFSGTIPAELGSLPELYYIALNSNKFTGKIPASIGNLSKLYWFDIADNQLTGTLPVSTDTEPGLDNLTSTKHFHFNKNKLSGTIPPKLFHSKMTLIHILFDANELTGSIPDTIGLIKPLEVLRLDRNHFNGSVPPSIKNLTNVNEMSLALNELTGPIPDLSGMINLAYLDLSNNTFNASEAPSWFNTLNGLNTLVMESGGLTGEVPERLLSLANLQQVKLRENKLNGTLDMSGSIGPQLQLLDFTGNDIKYVTKGSSSKINIILMDNPYCDNPSPGDVYCRRSDAVPYSTSLQSCGPNPHLCTESQSRNPSSCQCAYPYTGQLIFRAPTFGDVTNATLFQLLERDLWTKLKLTPGSAYLENPFFNDDNYLEVGVKLFPSDAIYFTHPEIQTLGFYLSNQTFKPPKPFGPFFFIASPYPFQDVPERKTGGLSKAVIGGIVAGCAVLAIGLVLLVIYAVKQKKRAEQAAQLSRPFASWGGYSGKDSGSAPQLKGARWFSFSDLKQYTSNFSPSTEIGSGGYGKVYRGQLPDGQLVAIKRGQQGSMQGGTEFKTEIELLSRVHHKNLVGLLGFCYEHGEQMLVYEFIPNGTLRDGLSGKSGIVLDWKRRLKIALGSARGLAYLHELAEPPIIHRDVKSTNILLDDKLSAKVADFGLSKLLSDGEKGHVSTQVKGTMGYLDPEYYMNQQLTEKSDVYSFGVVMLELVTARQPIQKGMYVVREVRVALDRDDEYYGLRNIMDPILRNMPNLTGFGRFVDLALKCLEECAADRPSMSEVVKEFETILQFDGSNLNSASSSATEFAGAKGQHPYRKSKDYLKEKDSSSDTFDNSSVIIFPAHVEPK